MQLASLKKKLGR